jgi:hypothetical protein
VPFDDAIQLRNWASCPEDSLLPLAEIARAILDRLEHSKVKAAAPLFRPCLTFGSRLRDMSASGIGGVYGRARS